MVRYTVRRILTGIAALFMLATVTFFLVHLMPGSPFRGNTVSEQVAEAVEREYGLDQPVLTQYRVYMGNLLRGDLGISYQEPGVRVTQIIGRAWPITLSVSIPALILAVVGGTLLGVWGAMTKRQAVKTAIRAAGMLVAGIPSFAAAVILLLVFSVRLRVLPASGLLTPAHYVLPTVALALYPMAVVSRMMANALEKEMESGYVRFAQAKGMGGLQTVWYHALRHAWLPVLHYIGPAAASLLTGSFVIESIFTIPGLGREFVSSITNRDYTMILGLTVFMGTVVIVLNLVTDLLSTWLDPRLRRQFLGRRK